MNDQEEEFIDGSIVVLPAGASVQEEMDRELNGTFIFPIMSESMKLLAYKDIQDITKENNALKDLLSKNNEEVRQVYKNLTEFKQQALQESTVQKEKVAKLQKENEILQDQLCQNFSENEKAREALTIAQADNSNLKSELSSLSKSLEHSKQLFSSVTSEVKRLESEVEALKLDKEKFSSQNSTLLGQLDKQNTYFKEQLAAADHRYKARDSEIQLLNEELEQSRSQVLKLNQELEHVSSEKGNLLVKLEKQSAAFQDEYRGAEKKIDELENNLSSLDNHMTEARNSESDAKSCLEEARKQINDLQEKADQLEQEKAKLLQHIQAMQKLRANDANDMGFSIVNQPNQENGENTPLQGNDDQQMLELQRLRQLVHDQKEQIEDLKIALSESQKKAEDNESDRFMFVHNFNCLTTATAVFEDRNETYQSLGHQLNVCQERLQNLGEGDSSHLMEDLKKEISELKQYLDQERQQNATQKKTLEEISTAWETFEAEQKNKYRQNEALIAIEKRQHQEKIDELTARNMCLEDARKEKENELNDLSKQILSLKNETQDITLLRAQNQGYEEDYRRICEEKAAVEATVDHLKQELSMAEAQVVSFLQDVEDSRRSSSHVDDSRRSSSHVEEQIQGQQAQEGNQEQGQQAQEGNQEQRPQAQEGNQDQGQGDTEQHLEEYLPLKPVEEFIKPRGRFTTHVPFKPRNNNEESGRSRPLRMPQNRRSQEPMHEDTNVSSVERRLFKCPKCNMTYTSVTALGNHMVGCQRED